MGTSISLTLAELFQVISECPLPLPVVLPKLKEPPILLPTPPEIIPIRPSTLHLALQQASELLLSVPLGVGRRTRGGGGSSGRSVLAQSFCSGGFSAILFVNVAADTFGREEDVAGVVDEEREGDFPRTEGGDVSLIEQCLYTGTLVRQYGQT